MQLFLFLVCDNIDHCEIRFCGTYSAVEDFKRMLVEETKQLCFHDKNMAAFSHAQKQYLTNLTDVIFKTLQGLTSASCKGTVSSIVVIYKSSTACCVAKNKHGMFRVWQKTSHGFKNLKYTYRKGTSVWRPSMSLICRLEKRNFSRTSTLIFCLSYLLASPLIFLSFKVANFIILIKVIIPTGWTRKSKCNGRNSQTLCQSLVWVTHCSSYQ